MLYLHCGWPRTSTTSLQTALVGRRDRLAAEGTLYPKQWLSPTGPTHHGLSEILSASLESRHALDDFLHFLEANSGMDLLFSAEVLTYWIHPIERQIAFVDFLRAAGRVTPTRCIWTLRRHDELLMSLYLLRMKKGRQPIPHASSAKETRPDGSQFAGLRVVADAVDGDVVYVKYDVGGRHNAELLRAFGVSAPLITEMGRELESSLRLHPSLTHKQAIVLSNVGPLSVRAGIKFDDEVLRAAFDRGDLEFEEDRRCGPIDPGLQRKIHERALAAARRHGLTAYLEFFDGVEDLGSPTSLQDSGAITDTDLELMVTFQENHLASVRT